MLAEGSVCCSFYESCALFVLILFGFVQDRMQNLRILFVVAKLGFFFFENEGFCCSSFFYIEILL